MTHGELIRKLRKERGLTQEVLCQNVCNRSTLSNFEKKDSHLSIQILTSFLDKLNITFDEYMYLYNNNNFSNKRNFSSTFYQKLELSYDKTYGNYLLHVYKETGDMFYYNLYSQYILIHFYLLKEEKIEKNLVEHIENKIKIYLNKVESWGRFELVFYYNCLFIFDDDYIFFNYQNLLKKMLIFNDHTYFSDDIIRFLINAVELSLDRNSNKNFLFFSKELEEYANKFNHVKAKIILKILLASYSNLSMEISEYTTLISFLEYSGLDYWKKYIKLKH